MKLLIKNIRKLIGVHEIETEKVAGENMARLPFINDAWLAAENGRIVDFGKMENFPGITDWSFLEVIDASGKTVMPTWCDSHTHLVHAGSREDEFVDKIKGYSYAEIAENGGGIVNSAKHIASATEDELFQSAKSRLLEVIRQGTGAIEIKSGYGLSLENEIKMLRVIKRLKEFSPIPIKSTFLGAHSFPLEYRDKKDEYVNLVIEKMIPAVAEEGLADYIDVFCDTGFFTPEQTERILSSAANFGMKPKIHANELDFSEGVQVGVKHRAISVDHLECVSDEEINVLLDSNTMPTLLPTTAFFIGLNYAPARQMINSGLPVALASDYNPGSSPSGRMSFVLSLACIKMKMLPEEAINAATLNGAYAMELHHDLGSICKGKKANLIITKEIPSVNYIPYKFGLDLIDTVIINGAIFND
jgi:imidazolonepropionase